VAKHSVNLSNFPPDSYPDFARVDPEGRRDLAIDTACGLPQHVMQQTGVVLPPDSLLRCVGAITSTEGTTGSRIEGLP